MADMTCGEIVLESANKQIRYKLFVTDAGALATVRLFPDPDGSWKPKVDYYKILASFNSDGHYFA